MNKVEDRINKLVKFCKKQRKINMVLINRVGRLEDDAQEELEDLPDEMEGDDGDESDDGNGEGEPIEESVKELEAGEDGTS